ncbi:hypothetical protein PspLS_09754 [Pyricularia sp. CBS 133598]|nr:hypothetical protein PspLS_09754 [Pyricularia sp. CBS 133598]
MLSMITINVMSEDKTTFGIHLDGTLRFLNDAKPRDLRRAAIAHAATNRLTELLWDQAIERAKYLDKLPEPKLYGFKAAWDIISALYWPDGGKELMHLLKENGEPILPLTKFIIYKQPTVRSLTQHELWQPRRTTSPKYWGYTSYWNFVDYPAVVFPATTVDPVKDVKHTGYIPINAWDKFVHDMYTHETFANVPVSLPIVGRRFHDEKVLAAFVQIGRALRRN